MKTTAKLEKSCERPRTALSRRSESAALGHLWAWLIGSVTALSGCVYLKKVDESPPHHVKMPKNLHEVATSSRAESSQWWRLFSDPTLEKLTKEAFSDNFDLGVAEARLRQATAFAKATGAAWYPALSLEGTTSRSRTANLFGTGAPVVIQANQYNASVAASYELDLFGRLAAADRAAYRDFQAAEEDLRGARVTLRAELLEAFFGLLELRERVLLTEKQVTVNETFANLIEARFRSGLVPGEDVLRQKGVLASTRAQAPLLKQQLVVAERALAMLVGDATLNRSLPEELPPSGKSDPPQIVRTDDLLARPDVEAARLRTVASDFRVAAKFAEHFPSVRLSGSVGYRSFRLSSLFDSMIWNLLGSLSAPVFQGGRIDAEVETAEAELEERLLLFKKAVLVAAVEVENALSEEGYRRESHREVKNQVQLARRSLSQIRAQYLSGLSDFLPVLTALTTLQQLEQEEVTARRAILSARVQLYRAVGGAGDPLVFGESEVSG